MAGRYEFQSAGGFLPRVESLRGIAAVLVGGYHVGQNLMPYFSSTAERLYMGICNGKGSVVAFFIISGFVLARSLDRRIRTSDQWAAQYFTARAFRLYPAAVAVVGLFVVLHYQFGMTIYYSAGFDPLNVLLNMLMLRTDIDRVMWSMKVELVATPLIPLAVIMFHRWGPRALLITIAVLLALSFSGEFAQALGEGSNLGPLYAFVCGIFLHFRGSRMAGFIKPGVAPLVAIGSVVVFFACGPLKETAIVVMIECVSVSILMLVVVWHPASAIFKPLDSAVVRFFGRISYSYYLLNPLTFWVLRRSTAATSAALDSGVPLVVVTVVAALLCILLTTPAAYLCWRFIEMPGVALGRAMSGRRLDRSRERRSEIPAE